MIHHATDSMNDSMGCYLAWNFQYESLAGLITIATIFAPFLGMTAARPMPVRASVIRAPDLLIALLSPTTVACLLYRRPCFWSDCRLPWNVRKRLFKLSAIPFKHGLEVKSRHLHYFVATPVVNVAKTQSNLEFYTWMKVPIALAKVDVRFGSKTHLT